MSTRRSQICLGSDRPAALGSGDTDMKLPRASGILLHPTSLPGRFGIGDLGPEAHAFVDFLAETGQRGGRCCRWGRPVTANSPYQSHSSFAGNPLLIGPDGLVERGWLDARGARRRSRDLPADRVDFDAVAELKGSSCAGPSRFRTAGDDPAFEEFCEDEPRLAGRLRASSRPSGTPTAASPGTSGSRSWSRASPTACDRWRERAGRRHPLSRVRPVCLRDPVAGARERPARRRRSG